MTAVATERWRRRLPGRFKPLTRPEECQRLLEAHGARTASSSQFDRISSALERQFTTIHNRAQLLLGICGILISASVLVATGRMITGGFAHARVAGMLLVLAGVFEIATAAVLVGGVLNVRWITQQPGADLRAWIMTNLEWRDSKTRAYKISTICLLAGMVTYESSVVIAVLRV